MTVDEWMKALVLEKEEEEEEEKKKNSLTDYLRPVVCVSTVF